MHDIQYTSLSFIKYNENIGHKSNLHVNFAIIPFSFLPRIAFRVNLYITRKDCIYDVGQICRKNMIVKRYQIICYLTLQSF